MTLMVALSSPTSISMPMPWRASSRTTSPAELGLPWRMFEVFSTHVWLSLIDGGQISMPPSLPKRTMVIMRSSWPCCSIQRLSAGALWASGRAGSTHTCMTGQRFCRPSSSSTEVTKSGIMSTT
jgi:hypothetical protein